jgi:hypothetical protein
MPWADLKIKPPAREKGSDKDVLRPEEYGLEADDPIELSAEDVLDRRFDTTGENQAGREPDSLLGNYAGGGTVKSQAYSPPARPFVIPLDALRKLGGGDVAIGHAIAHDLTGSPVMSGGLGIIHPDAVTAIGHGDHRAGHKVLGKLVQRIRRQRTARPMPPILSITIERG